MEIKVFVQGYIRSVSGEGRNYGSYIGVEPVVCPVSEPGYFPTVHSANLGDYRLTNLKAEIESICRPLVPRIGQGAHTIDVELTPLAHTELELARSLSQRYADETATQLRSVLDEKARKAAEKRVRRESFQQYLAMLPDAKAIDGVLSGDDGGRVTLTAYPDGLGFVRYRFATGLSDPQLPLRAYGGIRFQSLQDAFDFGFNVHHETAR